MSSENVIEAFVSVAKVKAVETRTAILNRWQQAEPGTLGLYIDVDVDPVYVGLVTLLLQAEGFPLRLVGFEDIENDDELVTYVQVDAEQRPNEWWQAQIAANTSSVQAE
jgi:hypothetical protein